MNRTDTAQSFTNYSNEFNTKTDDEILIEAWLSKIGKLNSVPATQQNKNVKKPLKISTIRKTLLRCSQIIYQLENLHTVLKDNVHSLSSDDWKKHTLEIGHLREELSLIVSQFQSPATLDQIKSTLNNRTKKRMSIKRRKLELKQIRSEERLKIAADHERIDRWLDSMSEAVERSKAEENMKKDADCVLAEVTKKKSDARKNLTLVSSLIKLRTLRENIGQQQGAKYPAEDRLAFEKTTERLLQMWENSYKVYLKEEQGLKIMLEQNTSNDRKPFVDKEKQIAQSWDHLLFGQVRTPPNQIFWGLTSAERDLEAFIAIRKSWDTFLTDDENSGSSIPIGWVFPPAAASEDWMKYLYKP